MRCVKDPPATASIDNSGNATVRDRGTWPSSSASTPRSSTIWTTCSDVVPCLRTAQDEGKVEFLWLGANGSSAASPQFFAKFWGRRTTEYRGTRRPQAPVDLAIVLSASPGAFVPRAVCVFSQVSVAWRAGRRRAVNCGTSGAARCSARTTDLARRGQLASTTPSHRINR